MTTCPDCGEPMVELPLTNTYRCPRCTPRVRIAGIGDDEDDDATTLEPTPLETPDVIWSDDSTG